MAFNKPVSVPSICASVTVPFSQTLVANLNGSFDIKHAFLDGSVPFHRHLETDEAFYLLSGKLTIEIELHGGQQEGGRVKNVELKIGDLFVVPTGLIHRPVGAQAHVLIMEKKGIPGGDGKSARGVEEGDMES
jgi:mannose-6-phosphate isomerase-like protein (cupin superfamily)